MAGRMRSPVVSRTAFRRTRSAGSLDGLARVVVRNQRSPDRWAVVDTSMAALGRARRAGLPQFTAECQAAGQSKATPLLLHYEAGGYNCLHQDLYGDLAFPLQLVCFLSEPGADYTGGDFLLVEQRPRAQ